MLFAFTPSNAYLNLPKLDIIIIRIFYVYIFSILFSESRLPLEAPVMCMLRFLNITSFRHKSHLSSFPNMLQLRNILLPVTIIFYKFLSYMGICNFWIFHSGSENNLEFEQKTQTLGQDMECFDFMYQKYPEETYFVSILTQAQHICYTALFNTRF